MTNNDNASPEDARHGQHPTTPDHSNAGGGRTSESAWIMQGLNQINDQLRAIEKRLGRLEARFYIAVGIVLGIGIVIGVVSRFVSFNFTIGIIPTQ